VNIDKPNNLEHMIVLAELLSSPFSFVRVDIYNVESGIYFGEYTFAPGAGSDNMSNEEWAVELCKRVKTAERQRTR